MPPRLPILTGASQQKPRRVPRQVTAFVPVCIFFNQGLSTLMEAGGLIARAFPGDTRSLWLLCIQKSNYKRNPPKTGYLLKGCVMYCFHFTDLISFKSPLRGDRDCLQLILHKTSLWCSCFVQVFEIHLIIKVLLYFKHKQEY